MSTTFVVDFNDVDESGYLSVSLWHTLEYGRGVLILTDRIPAIGERVRLYCSDEHGYFGAVVRTAWDDIQSGKVELVPGDYVIAHSLPAAGGGHL